MFDTLGEILVWVLLLAPIVAGLISASKGVSREDAQLPCAACKQLIPATAKVCPYCRRSAGHDVFSRKGKELDNNTKRMRFFRTLIGTAVAEVVIVVLVAFLIK